ncbi:unnamed protein product, partial [Gadus morhua 'NCC']
LPHRRVTFSTANQAQDLQDPSQHSYYDSGLEESETPSSKSSNGPRIGGPLALPEDHYERTTPDGSIGEMEHPETACGSTKTPYHHRQHQLHHNYNHHHYHQHHHNHHHLHQHGISSTTTTTSIITISSTATTTINTTTITFNSTFNATFINTTQKNRNPNSLKPSLPPT